MGHGGMYPHFYKWLGTGGTMSKRTVNKKLTKEYTDHHESAHQTTSCTCRAKKVDGHDKKIAPDVCPH